MTRDLGIDAAGNRAGDAVARVPGVGRWLGGIVVAGTSLVAAVVASVTGLATRNVPAALAGGVIMVLGKVIALVQAVVGLQRQRVPTAEEAALLTEVYRGSVDLSAVRLVPGRAGVFGVNPRPFTLGATIYLKRNTLSDHVLVHECAHVWQYQHLGSRYAFDAIWAQWTVKPDAYAWADELERGRRHWREFNREAQAKFLEDVACRHREFFAEEPVAGGARFVHDRVDHTDLARAAVAQVRAGRLS
ncbi:hypothetical protein [Actinophytocola sp.]|uniref:hypothetical protein n=1 Tax=Actinophytocola sp. TaxID=1872138 RepID=UPI003D6BFD16